MPGGQIGMNRLFKFNNQDGFTLVELMLAMVLFSTILVISTVGFIGMNRTFNRGTIKKQLSESVQTTTEDIARALRAQSNSSPAEISTCGPTDTTCVSYLENWNTLLIGSTCYLWQESGLHKSTGSCNPDNKQELLDSRYVVRYGPDVALVGTGSGTALYKVSGVFTTDQLDAIHAPNSDGESDTDSRWHCRGTAESSNVITCAVEEFNIIINPQGSAI